jgi:hypothetical protein
MQVCSIAFALTLTCAAPAFAADAPASPPPRPAPAVGTVVSVDAKTLEIKATDGTQVKFAVAPNVGVTRSRPGTTADLKSGEFIGTTAVEGPDGKLRATEVHIFPESMRGTGEGHYPWRPNGAATNTTMTNGDLVTLTGTTDGSTIKVSYKGGTSTVLVPPSATITVIEAAKLSDVKPGEVVTIFAGPPAADGTRTAMGIGLASPAK